MRHFWQYVGVLKPNLDSDSVTRPRIDLEFVLRATTMAFGLHLLVRIPSVFLMHVKVEGLVLTPDD